MRDRSVIEFALLPFAPASSTSRAWEFRRLASTPFVLCTYGNGTGFCDLRIVVIALALSFLFGAFFLIVEVPLIFRFDVVGGETFGCPFFVGKAAHAQALAHLVDAKFPYFGR